MRREVWTAFVWLMIQWWTLVNTVKNIHFPLRGEEVLDLAAQILAFYNGICSVKLVMK